MNVIGLFHLAGFSLSYLSAEDIIRESRNKNVFIRQLDLTSLKSVRKFATDILKSELRLDVLINNAGCATIEKKLTEDGLEVQMQSNHFGHFLLTNLLLGKSLICGVFSVEGNRYDRYIIHVSISNHFMCVSSFTLTKLKG